MNDTIIAWLVIILGAVAGLHGFAVMIKHVPAAWREGRELDALADRLAAVRDSL